MWLKKKLYWDKYRIVAILVHCMYRVSQKSVCENVNNPHASKTNSGDLKKTIRCNIVVCYVSGQITVANGVQHSVDKCAYVWTSTCYFSTSLLLNYRSLFLQQEII